MAEPVRVRRLTDQEAQKQQQIVRRGSTSSVLYRRAMMLPASAGGSRGTSPQDCSMSTLPIPCTAPRERLGA
ncbi:hypothetical protein F2B00_19285 [Streptomyces parvus]|nr:hypothetical protein F2B00_19285 [Streptomyces parvus]